MEDKGNEEIIQETPTIEETPVVEEPKDDFQEFTDEEFSELLSALETGIESLKEDVEPEVIRPTFEEKKEDEPEISDEEAEKYLNDLDAQIKSANETISEKEQNEERLLKEIEELKSDFTISEGIFEKLANDPVIGQYVRLISEGQEINIPEIIKKNLAEGLNHIPKTEKTETVMVSIPKTEKPAPKIAAWGNMGGTKLFD